MPTIDTLNVPVKSGGSTSMQALALTTTIKKLNLPVLEDGEIVYKLFDLPSEGEPGEVVIAVGVHTSTPDLIGKTCTCTDSLGSIIDSKVVTQDGWAVFALANTGTYTFTITY